MQVSRCCCGPGGCDPVTGFVDEFNTFSYSVDPPAATAGWKGYFANPGSMAIRISPPGTLELAEQELFFGRWWVLDRCANANSSIIGMLHRLKGEYQTYPTNIGGWQGVSLFAVFDSTQWVVQHVLQFDEQTQGWRLAMALGYIAPGAGGSQNVESYITGVLQGDISTQPQGAWTFDMEVIHEQINANQWSLVVTNFGNVVFSVVTAPPASVGPEWRHGFGSAASLDSSAPQVTRIDRFSYIARTA